MNHWPFIFLFACLWGCAENEVGFNKFSDPNLVTIANLQDLRSGDSLILFFGNENPSYRESAVFAFGSIQDSNFVEPLKNVLLTDNESSVRRAAAYAIGQTSGSRSEIILAEAFSKEKSALVLSEIIQAYGKVARSWKLNVTPGDTVVSEGLAWGYYRMAVRGKSDSVLNRKSAELLHSSSSGARLAAAHYFARGAKGFQKHSDQLINSASRDRSPLVRMAAALGLGKITSEPSLKALIAIAENDADYRVRHNAIRSLQNFPFNETSRTLLNALNANNINVSISAAEIITVSASIENLTEVLTAARNATNWRVRANLFNAALSISASQKIATEIRVAIAQSANPYEQAALLTALQHMPSSAEYLHQQLMKRPEPVIKTSSASALVEINKDEQFDKTLSPVFAKYYEEAIGGGDMAVIGIVCSALADSALNYRSIIKDFSFLKRAKDKLSLPRDYELVIPLNMAINYFEGKNENSTLANDFNHPIDWNLVRKIPADQEAIIKTSRGNVEIRLFVDEAPGSVANFVSLAKSKYYDGKRIHRVAPNFVVQGGCPRGDGWGSEDYSIRSEFMPHSYATGSIGMASAGKDTEGTQWFITHSPTPHLEGRYTLFAEVVSGMDIVHQIEIGDSITSIEIIHSHGL